MDIVFSKPPNLRHSNQHCNWPGCLEWGLVTNGYCWDHALGTCPVCLKDAWDFDCCKVNLDKWRTLRRREMEEPWRIIYPKKRAI